MDNKIDMDYVFREWDAKIATTIIGAGIPYDQVEDVKSDIYLDMVRRDICKKYDPSRAKCFSTYLYKFVYSLISNHFLHTKRKKRIPSKMCVSIDDLFEKTRNLSDDFIFLELMSSYDSMLEIEQNLFVEEILEQMDIPKHRKLIVSRSGTPVSLKNIVALIFQGFTIKEISDKVDVKVASIRRSLHCLKDAQWFNAYLNGYAACSR